MQQLFVNAILVILFVYSTTFSQIWFVKNVSNVSLDDCYVSFGDNCGIAYCHPERYNEPEKLADWNDDALYYILYPVHTFDRENDDAAAKKKKRSERRRKRKRRSDANKDADSDSLAHKPPTRVYNQSDSLAILERGTILFTYEDLLIYETFTQIQESEYSSYRPFQLLKPSVPGLSSDEDR
jgi:hypothetical protein